MALWRPHPAGTQQYFRGYKPSSQVLIPSLKNITSVIYGNVHYKLSMLAFWMHLLEQTKTKLNKQGLIHKQKNLKEKAGSGCKKVKNKKGLTREVGT